MQWFKIFHIIGFILWVGSLMDLSRILGYHVKEEIDVQKRLAAIEFRIYWFVATIGLVITLIMGICLFEAGGGVDHYFRGGGIWFHIKSTLLVLFVGIHALIGHLFMNLRRLPEKKNPAIFKALHGIMGLLLIGIVSMAVLKI